MPACPPEREPLATAALSDAELVASVRRNPECCAELYERYADRVYRYALKRTRSASLAAEIVSETMIRALEGLERLDPDRGSFADWLFAIVRHRILDHQRAYRRLGRALARLRTLPVHDDPLTTVVESEDAARVRAALRRLSPDDQEVLLLRYSAGLSSREIGEALHIAEGAARVRLSRARQRLAREMEASDV